MVEFPIGEGVPCLDGDSRQPHGLLNGVDYRPEPLEKRKLRVASLVGEMHGIRFVAHMEGDGAVIFEHGCKLELEGIVSRRRDMPYRS